LEPKIKDFTAGKTDRDSSVENLRHFISGFFVDLQDHGRFSAVQICQIWNFFWAVSEPDKFFYDQKPYFTLKTTISEAILFLNTAQFCFEYGKRLAATLLFPFLLGQVLKWDPSGYGINHSGY
jgi:hypothetical protein